MVTTKISAVPLLLVLLGSSSSSISRVDGSSSSSSSSSSIRSVVHDVGKSIVNRGRRTLNLASMFGSATDAPAYDRIASQPVFSVGTPWGSPYLLFERIESGETRITLDEPEDNMEEKQDLTSLSSGRGEKTRQIALYFLDPHDAIALRDEMLQMDVMKDADMRINVSSLSKAMSQASNLVKGLPTGQPMDDLTGRMKTPEEGGSLRYKIVPPKRELFYAARCYGRERVGLGFNGDTPEYDAEFMLQTNTFLGTQLINMKTRALERLKKNRGQVILKEGVDPIQKEYAFMEGNIGIPIFYCPGLHKQNSFLKSILRLKNKDTHTATPLFFSYEDLQDAWTETASKNTNKTKQQQQQQQQQQLPSNPPNVQVFNLIDVVSSIEKAQWQNQRNAHLVRKKIISNVPLLKKINQNDAAAKQIKLSTGLENIVFVPNSKASNFKQTISKVGNGKPRGLRPMRPWGRDAM